MKRVSALVTLAVLGAGLGGCEQPPGHLPMTTSAFGPLPGDKGEQLPATNGAIYQATAEGNGGLELFLDHRAYQVGDIITVAIAQSASASKNVSQNVGRSDSINSTVGNFFGVPLAFGRSHDNGTTVNKFNPNLSYNSANSLKCSGSTAQSDSVITTVSAMVQRIRPNGDLVIKGENVVQLVGGKEFIRIAGVVRPEDISSNTVSSTRMAEGYIEFSGDGETYLAPKMGFLQRLFMTVSTLWPDF